MVELASRRWISPPRSEVATALDTALRFLARRPRSEYEVRQRLRRAGVDDAGIERVLEQLRRHGLVDDESFAAYWVEQRQMVRPRGGRLVRAELARLGVGRAAADEATTVLDGSAQEDAYRAAARYAPRLRGLDETNFRRRLAQWLARRGFDWDTIAHVVERVAQENGVSTS